MNIPLRIAVLMACHNRKDITCACLERVFMQEGIEGNTYGSADFEINIYLVDDGSTDGTTDAVKRAFPRVRIIPGDGGLFWCGGMRKAWGEAAKGDYDAYLWLNDDTILVSDAIRRLIETAQTCGSDACSVGSRLAGRLPECLVVGAVRDPQSGLVSYGEWTPRGVEGPSETRARRINWSFHGNLVLVTNGAYERLGNLDAGFSHGFGDIEYGFRARNAGVPVFLAAGFLAECPRNDMVNWKRPDVPLRKRWREFHSPKGCPPRELARFAKRCNLGSWPRIVCQAYLRMLIPSLWTAAQRDRA